MLGIRFGSSEGAANADRAEPSLPSPPVYGFVPALMKAMSRSHMNMSATAPHLPHHNPPSPFSHRPSALGEETQAMVAFSFLQGPKVTEFIRRYELFAFNSMPSLRCSYMKQILRFRFLRNSSTLSTHSRPLFFPSLK